MLINLREDGFLHELEKSELAEWQKMRILVGHGSMALTGGKKCAFFVHDISMPVINCWGDQITNEIVRQCLDEDGCYNVDKAGEWRIFADMGHISGMMHPGGGITHSVRVYNLFTI